MRCVLKWLALAGVVVAALGFWSCEARAQSALERLELQLQGVPPVGAEPRQTPAPPKPAAPEVIPTPGAGKAYLAVLADDRNDRGRGVRVLKTFPGGAGDKAGLKQQDLITSMADVRIRQMSDLADLLDLYSPGDQAWIEVQRDGKTQRLRLTFDARPADGQAPAPPVNPSAPAVPPIVPPPVVPEVVPAMPALPETPPAPDAALSDRQRIALLEQRIAELEQRITQMERRLSEKGK